MELRWPSDVELPSYVAALERGWAAHDDDAGADRRQLAAIRTDPAAFLASLVDLDASGGPVRLPDGTIRERIPGYRKWMWDGEVCGSISFRWQPGTEALPAHVLGHVGYTVVPWKRGRGDATQALALILDDARERGLRWIEVTTDPDNVASQRVIEANAGRLVERAPYPVEYLRGDLLRYRITL
jgi:predicted acetyltransferase